MIRYTLIIALSLGVTACGKHRASPAPDANPSMAVAGSDDPKPFTLACDGQVADGMGLVRGAVKFSLTIDAANTESLLSNAVANPISVLPPSFLNRNGDIIKVTINDRVVIADLNDVNRQDADSRITIDRQTGKFAGPDTSGSCTKASLIPMPMHKF